MIEFSLFKTGIRIFEFRLIKNSIYSKFYLAIVIYVKICADITFYLYKISTWHI